MQEDDGRDKGQGTHSAKKRPRGIASAKAAKKQRFQPEDRSAEAETQDSRTVLLPGELDETDEVGQLAALYSTAVERLNKEDSAAALPILNGTVHEADRILRNSPQDGALPYEFHWVYAGALLDLSFSIDDAAAKEGESTQDFIDTAMDRCDVGILHGTGSGLPQLTLVKARCIARGTQHLLSHADSNVETMVSAIEDAMRLIDSSFKAIYYVPLQLSRTLNLIQCFADSLLEAKPKLHASINHWVEEKWTSVLTEDQENISALEGCGRVWLSLAQPHLMALEDEDDRDPDEVFQTNAREALETSVELLSQAVTCAQRKDAVTGDLLCLLAEATISLANTYDDGLAYDALEQEALHHLRRAEDIKGFELPQRFQDILDGAVSYVEQDESVGGLIDIPHKESNSVSVTEIQESDGDDEDVCAKGQDEDEDTTTVQESSSLPTPDTFALHLPHHAYASHSLPISSAGRKLSVVPEHPHAPVEGDDGGSDDDGNGIGNGLCDRAGNDDYGGEDEPKKDGTHATTGGGRNRGHEKDEDATEDELENDWIA